MAATQEQATSTILVGSLRKPATYVDLCSEKLNEFGEVQLSGLGMAISSVATVAQLLKDKNLAVEKSIESSCETLTDEEGTRQKPKLHIVLVKSAEFGKLYAESKDKATAA